MSETDDARFAMHQRSGCSREWFHDGPCAPDALWAKPELDLTEWLWRYFERLDFVRATSDPDEQAQYGAGVELAEREVRARLKAPSVVEGAPAREALLIRRLFKDSGGARFSERAVLEVIDRWIVRHPEESPRRGPDPETVARWFHEAYERLAPSFGYETRKASAVPWESVPEPNRSLMVAVAAEVRDRLLKP